MERMLARSHLYSRRLQNRQLPPLPCTQVAPGLSVDSRSGLGAWSACSVLEGHTQTCPSPCVAGAPHLPLHRVCLAQPACSRLQLGLLVFQFVSCDLVPTFAQERWYQRAEIDCGILCVLEILFIF